MDAVVSDVPARTSAAAAAGRALASTARGITTAAMWMFGHLAVAFEFLVIAGIVVLCFAVSARHVLELGEHHDVQGALQLWAVAGTVELITAYAGLEFRRRPKGARALPGAIFVAGFGFMVVANNAASGVVWAAELPWKSIYYTTPAVVFVGAALLLETKQWTGRKPKPAVKPKSPVQQRRDAKPAEQSAGAPSDVQPPKPRKSESRQAWVARCKAAPGVTWAATMRAGAAHFNVSESTIKRDLREAKAS